MHRTVKSFTRSPGAGLSGSTHIPSAPVSRTGIHCIARANPLDRIVKFDGVEIYTNARYFTFTGRSFGEIKAAPAEISALVDEVRARKLQQNSSRG